MSKLRTGASAVVGILGVIVLVLMVGATLWLVYWLLGPWAILWAILFGVSCIWLGRILEEWCSHANRSMLPGKKYGKPNKYAGRDARALVSWLIALFWILLVSTWLFGPLATLAGFVCLVAGILRMRVIRRRELGIE